MTQREERLAKLLDSGRKGYGMPVQATDVSILLRYAVDMEAENERLKEDISTLEDSNDELREVKRPGRIRELAAENERLRAVETKYHEALDVLSAWDKVDKAEAIARALQAEARVAALEAALKTALDNVLEHVEGCLYCGEDEDYVKEHGETSMEHRAECWYYMARAALARPTPTQGE